MTLGALLAVLAQSAVGIVVNLYVTVPTSHPGAEPASYLSGSVDSVAWSIRHGAAPLVIHAVLGILVAVMTLSVVVQAARVGRRLVLVGALLAALLVIGAGFSGASFLDFNDNASSLAMALLALGAVATYAYMLFLLGATGRDD
jgi:hypothetical protein